MKLRLRLKIFQQTKDQDQMASQANSIRTFTKELTPMLLKLFQNIAEGGTLPLILQGHHHPDTKTRQRCHEERKLQASITDEHRCKNPQQNTSKQNPTAH